MVIRTIKTYACKKAIEISKPITANTIDIGRIFQNQWTIFDETLAQTNEIKIFNKIWPDNMFANNLIAKLKILEIYETYSIKIKKGTIGNGTPSGKNNTKKACLW